MTRTLGIPFRDELVRAILEGRKTVTRRVKATYREGDLLYVREAWHANFVDGGRRYVRYRADGEVKTWPDSIRNEFDRVAKRGWRPARFMFKALSRLHLRVIERREEPLQSITPEEARAEGLASIGDFAATWDAIHKDPAHQWAANPKVYVYRFEVVR